MPDLFPSLISADLLNLEKEIKRLEPYCAGFHLDIMDFHFVPNLTWGPGFVNAIAQITNHQLWIHLMVDSPALYFDRLRLRPGDIVSIHAEAVSLGVLAELLGMLRSANLLPSVALNPSTPLQVIQQLFEYDSSLWPAQVILMSVEPGFSGQTMLPGAARRAWELRQIIKQRAIPCTIGMDGGITLENVGSLLEVDQIAVASGIFKEKDQIETMKRLQE